jgi:VWFA-related protein
MSMRATLFIVIAALVTIGGAVPSTGTAPFHVAPIKVDPSGASQTAPPPAITASTQTTPSQTQRSRVVANRSAAPVESPTPPPSASEDEVVRVETNLVNTLFTAIDQDRHFITSLRAEDVRVFENDVAQPISLFERETNRPLSLAILVDTSASQREVLPDEKSAAREFIDSVIRPEKDRAAVVSFTGVPKVEQELTNNLAKLHRGIERVRVELPPEIDEETASEEQKRANDEDPRGYTSIWDSTWMAIKDLLSQTPEGSRRAIVLLTDGDDTKSKIKKQDLIDFAVKSDVVIYSIGIRDAGFPEGKLDADALRKVSDRTGGRAFFPAQASELQASFAQIDQELRSQYLIAYSPTNKTRDGAYRRVKIEVVNSELRKQKPQLLYRQGYYAKKN